MASRRDALATVDAYVGLLVRRDLGAIADVVATDAVGHEPGGDVVGIQAIERNLAAWFDAFPEMRLETDDLFADGDRVAWRWSLSGTHSRVQRMVRTSGTIVFRVADGRIAEYWGQYDRMGLQQQLDGP